MKIVWILEELKNEVTHDTKVFSSRIKGAKEMSARIKELNIKPEYDKDAKELDMAWYGEGTCDLEINCIEVELSRANQNVSFLLFEKGVDQDGR